MRSFEFTRKKINGEFVDEKAYPDARLPEYQTKHSAGADFFCAEKVVIPSIWSVVARIFVNHLTAVFKPTDTVDLKIQPTLIHTGIKASMEEDEVLELYNRSSNPKKLGLVLANSVGVVDADYYNNSDNDGELMFSFYNFSLTDKEIHVGDRIGQGVFKKFLRPTEGLCIKDAERVGGYGSTGK